MFTILGIRKEMLSEVSPGALACDILVVITSSETREGAMKAAQTFFMTSSAKRCGPYTGLAILYNGVLNELKLTTETTVKLSIMPNTRNVAKIVR